MNRGQNFKKDHAPNMVGFRVAAIGTGATAPAVPADGRFTPTTSTFPRRLNAISLLTAEAPTRTGAGVYTITISADFKLVNAWPTAAVVLSAGGAPTALLEATPTIYDPATRILTVKTFIGNGTATDLGTSDMLVVTFEAQDSSA